MVSILILSVIAVSAQDGEQSGVIKTANGVLVVWNEPGNIYTMEIKGQSINPIPDHTLWFEVDGKFFQIVTALKSQFLKDSRNKNLDEKAILNEHQTWESDYIAETLGAKLKINSSWVKLLNGMTALSWNYDMPQVDPKQTARKQLYLTVLKGDRVLVVNTIVEKDGEEKGLQQFLVDTMSTLKPNDKPLSLQKASENIKNGK